MNVYVVEFSVVYSPEIEDKVLSQCTCRDVRILNLINVKDQGEYLHATLLVASFYEIERVIFALNNHYTFMANKPFGFIYSFKGEI